MYNHYYNIVWCTVTDAKGKQYNVCSKSLETETGEKLSQNDLLLDGSVIWRLKGKPYEVVITEISSKF